jgi:transcriptional regulator with XRE-family HTH domain
MRRVRETLGLSQAAVARKAGLHPSTVSLIECARLKAGEGQAKRIARALGWAGDLKELFDEIWES